MPVVRFLLIFLCLGVSVAQASPTSNEWRDCHKLAARALQACLDRIPGYTEEAQQKCWQDAQARQRLCYRMVQRQYDSSKDIAARRAAEEKAKAAAAASKSE